MTIPKVTANSALQAFLNTPLETTLARHLNQAADRAAIALFHTVTTHVPAYQQYLTTRQKTIPDIKNYSAFRQLPLMTKQDYILAYRLAERCWHGKLESNEMIAVSSGSTGKPIAWPRSLQHELDIATRFEQIFKQSFHADTRSTLAVICFALGTWVGGMYTANCCRLLSFKGYPVTLVTPGNNKDEIYRVIEDIGNAFDQVVLLGYPPFIKDVIDTGIARNIDWPRYKIKMVFAGEVFSEEWRSLVCARAGAGDPCLDTASLYGTADAGVLGNETPLSITLRRFFSHHPEAARTLFGESRLPTLVQYDPLSRFFETHQDTLVVTGDNGVPLIRYHIADKGGIVAYDDMLEFVRKHGGGLEKEILGKPGIPLPFVYVFGRTDFTVSFFGANIYPENVAVGLEQAGIHQWASGKFVLRVKETADHNELLSITVELLPGISADEDKQSVIADSIRQQLLRLNSEFAHYVPVEYQRPEVILRPAADPEFFPTGVKHRYTRK